MYKIDDVADFVILKLKQEDNHSLINLKLQKLLYFIQAWHWGIYKKPFFKGDFQAWVHGPVNKEIYDRFVPTKYLYSEIELNDVLNTSALSVFKPEDSEYIEWILENYAQFSGAELEQISHQEQPWVKTRGTLKPEERCTEIIPNKLISEYYAQKWSEIKQK